MLQNLIMKKKLAHRKYKKYGKLEDYNEFYNLRKICKHQVTVEHDYFLQKTEESVHSNPMSFWQFIKKQRGASDIPNDMIYNGITAKSGNNIVNFFAKFFETNFLVNPKPLMNIVNNYYSNICINQLNLKISDVFTKLEQLKTKRSVGPDDVSSVILYNCRYSLARPLTEIFNNSLMLGKYPTAWKLGQVTPILKCLPRN